MLLESRRAVVDIIHSLSHPSIRSTVKLVNQKFVWNKMATDIKEWIKACPQCQACKVQRQHRQHSHANTPLQLYSRQHRETPFSIQPDALPVHRHRQVHSLVGSNPDVRCNYRDMRVGTSTPLGLTVWHARAYDVRVSNSGSQFTSSLWDGLSYLLGIELHHTTAYHPQSNGLLERWH